VKLAQLINSYRISKKLDSVNVSSNLNMVAQTHANDLHLYYKESNRCNMHSWSRNGKWKDCCYTDDHKQAKCMWDKPREISSYKGDGFEIAAYYSDGMTAERALELWKKSSSHHDVILQKGIWKNKSFKAMGIGIKGNYACVWFGFEPDSN
jgi:uncharacterized protein YkwD